MDSDIEVGHRIHDLKIDSSPNTILSKNSVEKVNKQEFENRPQKQKQSLTLLQFQKSTARNKNNDLTFPPHRPQQKLSTEDLMKVNKCIFMQKHVLK